MNPIWQPLGYEISLKFIVIFTLRIFLICPGGKVGPLKERGQLGAFFSEADLKKLSLKEITFHKTIWGSHKIILQYVG